MKNIFIYTALISLGCSSQSPDTMSSNIMIDVVAPYTGEDRDSHKTENIFENHLSCDGFSGNSLSIMARKASRDECMGMGGVMVDVQSLNGGIGTISLSNKKLLCNSASDNNLILSIKSSGKDHCADGGVDIIYGEQAQVACNGASSIDIVDSEGCITSRNSDDNGFQLACGDLVKDFLDDEVSLEGEAVCNLFDHPFGAVVICDGIIFTLNC